MEQWRGIAGFDGYEVSSFGNLRAMFSHNKRPFPRTLNSRTSGRGYHAIHLWRNGKRSKKMVHRLVVEAFIGHIPDDMVVNHIDGVKVNNRVDNLEIVTQFENMRHAARMKLLPNSKKTHCKHGHQFNKENTYIDREGFRMCRACWKISKLRSHLRKHPASPVEAPKEEAHG